MIAARLQQSRYRLSRQGRQRPRHRRLQRGDPARSQDRHAPSTTEAYAYRDKGDNDRAIADYNEAIRLDPKYAIAYNNRGIAYRAKGDNDRAIADYSEAIRLDPKYAVAFNNRGIAYRAKGDHDRAIADYSEAIRLDPKYASAFNSRGIAYQRQGRQRPRHRRLQ